MKVFLAGASGAVGKSLVPLLVKSGHQVVATTRTPGKLSALRAFGAEPIVLNALDRTAVLNAVESARPDVVVHQLTALATAQLGRKIDQELAVTNRLRTEGIAYLLEAAQAAGARRFIAQSYIGMANIREGGPVKTEDDPLDPNPPRWMKQTVDTLRHLEATVGAAANITGIVLRYGSFYGPGTAIAPHGQVVNMVLKRRFPLFGDGAGVWSFVHIDDVAAATRIAIEGGPAGVYNIVDDEPAAVSEWLPELARIVGAKPPYRLPAWLGRILLGEVGISLMTKLRGSSNANAKRVLSWQPMFPTWRTGFRGVLSSLTELRNVERQHNGHRSAA